MFFLFFVCVSAYLGPRISDEVFRYDFQEEQGLQTFDQKPSNFLGPLQFSNGVAWRPTSAGVDLNQSHSEILSNNSWASVQSTLTQISFEVWYQMPQPKNFAGLIGFALPNGSVECTNALNPNVYMFGAFSPNQYNIVGSYLEGDGYCSGVSVCCVIYTVDNLTTPLQFHSNETLTQLVVTSDNNQVLIYIDGKFRAILDSADLFASPSLLPSNLHLSVAHPFTNFNYPSFVGSIFLVAMYNRILTPSEVQTNYNAGIANSRPFVHEEVFYAFQNFNLTINLHAHDDDNTLYPSHNETITFYIATFPSKGKLFIEGENVTQLPARVTGELQYLPPLNQYGTNFTSFRYYAGDGQKNSTAAFAYINITHVNQLPIPNNLSAQIFAEQTPLNLSGTDIEEGTNLQIAVVTKLPLHGLLFRYDGTPILDDQVLSDRENLTVLYEPTDFDEEALIGERIIGRDSFEFILSDGENFSTAIGHVTIEILNPLQADNITVYQLQERRTTFNFSGFSKYDNPVQFIVNGPPVNGQLFIPGSSQGISTFPFAVPVVNGSANRLDYFPSTGLTSVNPPLDNLTYYLKTADNKLRSEAATVFFAVKPINHPPTLVGVNQTNIEVTYLQEYTFYLTLSDHDAPIVDFTVSMATRKNKCKVKPEPSMLEFLIFTTGDGNYQFNNTYNGSRDDVGLSLQNIYIRCFGDGDDILDIFICDNGGFEATPAYPVNYLVNITSVKTAVAVAINLKASPEIIMIWMVCLLAPVICLVLVCYKQCRGRFRGYKRASDKEEPLSAEHIELNDYRHLSTQSIQRSPIDNGGGCQMGTSLDRSNRAHANSQIPPTIFCIGPPERKTGLSQIEEPAKLEQPTTTTSGVRKPSLSLPFGSRVRGPSATSDKGDSPSSLSLSIAPTGTVPQLPPSPRP